MESKIRVEHDFGNSQTWLQMYVSTNPREGGQPDLRDLALKTFIEKATREDAELFIEYPESNNDNSVVKIMVRRKLRPTPVLIDWREEIEKNHIKINAERKQSFGEDTFYKNGKSYNLMFAIADDNCVIIKYGGVKHTEENTFWRYTSLSQFLEYWIVNPVTS